MKETSLFASLMCVLISTCALGIGGNMGGTDPNGSPEKPYLIEDLADFDTFADPNNAVTYWASGVHTKLMTDIDLSGRTYTTAAIAPDTSTGFTGIFDGNSHTVSNLTIDTVGADNDYLGLFGRIENYGTEVKNLGVVDCNIIGENNFSTLSSRYLGGLCGYNGHATIANCYSTGLVKGNRYIGGLVGRNFYGSIMYCYSTGNISGVESVGGLVGESDYSSIMHCYSTGNISGVESVGGLMGRGGGTSVTDCYSTGDVSGTGDGVGGLLGSNSGPVMHSYSTGSVSGTGNYAGGLVGNNSGSIANCYSTDFVEGVRFVGGLVGENLGGNLINCFSLGSVSGTNGYIGGLVGLNENSSTTNCYSAGQVNGTGDYIGGFIGYNSSTISSNFWDIDFSGTSDGVGNQNPDPTGVMGKTTTEMQISHTFISVGWDFTNEIANGTNQIWQMPSTEGYPVLSNFNGFVPVALNGNGSEINPWKINDAVELGTIYHYRSNACYELTSDIDLSSIQWSSAVIPMFKGSFDGTGYTIFNLNIDGGGYLGLLGYLGSNATVIGLGLENVSITGTGDSIGGLVGAIDFANVTNCYSTGSVIGNEEVGGLIGISDSASINNCYSAGLVSGANHAGGLVGENEHDSIVNCYSTCDVSGEYYIGGLIGNTRSNSITNCYSSGNVNGDFIVGGLCGGNSGSLDSITSSFWDVETSGIGNSGDDNLGATGKTTTEMQTQSTFTGWDFNPNDGDAADWMMLRAGEDYPRLAGQEVFVGDIAGLYGADMVDFAYLANYWGQDCDNPECDRADIDESGDVGVGDLVYVANDWLK